MRHYIYIRVVLSSDCSEWLVQGKTCGVSPWENIRVYPLKMSFSRDVAITYACVFAQDASLHSDVAISVFDENSCWIKSYTGGRPCVFNGDQVPELPAD